MIASSKNKPKEPVTKLYATSTKSAMKASRPTALPSLEMFFRLISMKLIASKRSWPSVKNPSIEFRAKILKKSSKLMPGKDS